MELAEMITRKWMVAGPGEGGRCLIYYLPYGEHQRTAVRNLHATVPSSHLEQARPYTGLFLPANHGRRRRVWQVSCPAEG